MEGGKLVGPNGLIHQQIKVENFNIWNWFSTSIQDEERMMEEGTYLIDMDL